MRKLAALFFLIASVTDYLDGMIARKLGQQTNFGEFLDPIADKLLVISMLVLLVTENSSIIFIIPVLIIISREFLVIAMRQRLAELRMQRKIKVLKISKIKTALQFISLLLLLYKYNIFGYDTYLFGILFLQLASILTVISFFYYVKNSWDVIIK
tara:strand:- start:27 stop:491 length:465 start_codon:yes stop_codon:yes gene_type:complete